MVTRLTESIGPENLRKRSTPGSADLIGEIHHQVHQLVVDFLPLLTADSQSIRPHRPSFISIGAQPNSVARRSLAWQTEGK
jgi:hypothetical protein